MDSRKRWTSNQLPAGDAALDLLGDDLKFGLDLGAQDPRVQGVRVGQTLSVKNSDKTLHKIHNMTTKNNPFNTRG